MNKLRAARSFLSLLFGTASRFSSVSNENRALPQNDTFSTLLLKKDVMIVVIISEISELRVELRFWHESFADRYSVIVKCNRFELREKYPLMQELSASYSI